MPSQIELLTDGAWAPAASGRSIAVPNPATNEEIGRLAHSETDELRRTSGGAHPR